jgi:hypothetical protein
VGEIQFGEGAKPFQVQQISISHATVGHVCQSNVIKQISANQVPETAFANADVATPPPYCHHRPLLILSVLDKPAERQTHKEYGYKQLA